MRFKVEPRQRTEQSRGGQRVRIAAEVDTLRVTQGRDVNSMDSQRRLSYTTERVYTLYNLSMRMQDRLSMQEYTSPKEKKRGEKVQWHKIC
jgi:hypothetical protein